MKTVKFTTINEVNLDALIINNCEQIKLRSKHINMLLVFLVFTSYLAVAQNYIVPPMVTIPESEFTMGHETDPAATPLHKVKVKSFDLAKYPVTVYEFRKFVKETGYTLESNCNDFMDKEGMRGPTFKGTGIWDKHRYSYSDFQPVTCISWNDAQNYIKWLNNKTRGTYRLPTEEEWEYAVKGGTHTRYFWGDDLNYSQAHLYGNLADKTVEYTTNNSYGYSSKGFLPMILNNDGEAFNSIVGMYRPNPYGLYDMHGNVAEMLNSCYYSSGYHIKEEMETNPKKCEFIAIRGGTWHYPPKPYFTRGRYKREGWSVAATIGFRLASDATNRLNPHPTTQQFEKELRNAIDYRINNRNEIIEAPKKLSLKRVNKETYNLTWHLSTDSRVKSYEVYKSKTPYSYLSGGYFKKYYDKIETLDSKSKSLHVKITEKGTSFIVVAVSEKMTSLPSKVGIEIEAKDVNIPGKISVQEFSEIENVPLYHIPAKKDKPEDFFLFKTNLDFENKQSSISFKVNVKKSGWYWFNYRGSSFIKDKFFDLWLDNKLVSTIEYDPKRNDKISLHNKLYLNEGKHSLQLTIMKEEFDRWSLTWLKFSEVKNQPSFE
ncbi:formylglycine-generating enzyme family protein [Tenacibaculum amylolyticum]|uniref:formylglycine-generating enzyme family protein n=1 Tax=Tenacibaculum amylolyticum TaxID=104269 RepID=UPI003892CDFE